MSSRGKILLLGEICHAQAQWEALNDLGELVRPIAKNRDEFIRECEEGGLDGVIAAYRTAESIDITGHFDKELMSVIPKSWVFLASCGAGYDPIDVKACSRREPPLRVSNVPTAVNDATADTAIFLMLGALRNFNPSMHTLRQGNWRGKQPVALGHDPQGKVLGILGMGSIGRNISAKAAAFGTSTIYHNRRKIEGETIEYVSFEDLLRRSNVLSLNVPLNSKTRHIISTAQLEMMKPTSIVINTARGAVLDEVALVEALENGTIAGAGLDVFEEEPNIHPGLIQNKNVILLPHMGTHTTETKRKMEEWTIENIREALEKGRLMSPVPEQQTSDHI
ncbi:D-3-phosphoglycerate dehydrogenase [Capronia coronata CBS 617.96]|uniref:D-3-phosphoglycerate dehydrogenase n=1 Tax=Capronia coronata CBS 617.96 TaxID=1182541 RepID=W9XYW9_9EURO|nr:D-3-phosphoglycerate dehydrogenase [Capronia coronata CBS 617.96]EXJ82176.1 D-3-phosphoglycerate dehydrogenase [Capronia coronata CBS 617.96]